MLDEHGVLDKLFKCPESFEKLMEQKQYCAAKWNHHIALATAAFIELDEEHMEMLFGKEGMFNRELVKKAYELGGTNVKSGRNEEKVANAIRNLRTSFETKGLLECDTDTKADKPYCIIS